jgi:hypothetical protein
MIILCVSVVNLRFLDENVKTDLEMKSFYVFRSILLTVQYFKKQKSVISINYSFDDNC